MRTSRTLPGSGLAALLSPFALALAGAAQATPNVPPPAQTKPLMITNARLHPVSGPAIESGRMLVERGRIAAIGGAELAAPAGATVVDVGGRAVYPGFVAANTTIGLVEINAVRATVDTAESGPLNPNARAAVAVNADSELFPVARAGGVLAVLSVPQAGQTPAGGGLIAGTSALMRADGWNWQDMALDTDVALHVQLPSLRFNAAVVPVADAASQQRLAELKRATQARLKLLEDSFEAAAAYARARAADPQLPVDTRWEAMVPVLKPLAGSKQAQRPVFVRADELAQIRWALAFAERFELKLVIVGGADSWRLADQLRERQVPVVIAGLNRLPLRRDDDTAALFELPARLAAAGVRFAIARGGNNADAANERNLPFEAGQAVAHGLAPDEALKAVTLYPAQILGAGDRLGSLEVGKLASFFVASGDPLDIRSRIERVFIDGREIELVDRQTRLRDKYEQRLRQ